MKISIVETGAMEK